MVVCVGSEGHRVFDAQTDGALDLVKVVEFVGKLLGFAVGLRDHAFGEKGQEAVAWYVYAGPEVALNVEIGFHGSVLLEW